MRSVDDVIEKADTIDEKVSSYDFLAPVYDFINKKHFNYQYQREIVDNISDPEDLIVELGCGTGNLIISTDRRNFIGVDINPTMLNRAKCKSPSNRYILADIRTPFMSEISTDGVVMLGRVFSKMTTDRDVEKLAKSISNWIPSNTPLVFNSFRRSDLIDGMEKEQIWSENDITISRTSKTNLDDERDGLMNIRMHYSMKNSKYSSEAREEFQIRGYNRNDIIPIFEKYGFSLENYERNKERSTHFFFFESI